MTSSGSPADCPTRRRDRATSCSLSARSPRFRNLRFASENEDRGVFRSRGRARALSRLAKRDRGSDLSGRPLYARDGGAIKPGYNAELDELRAIQDHSKEYLLALEQREREKTGIKTLRVGYNRVFGYYIEVSKGASALVRDEFGYIRKQTLSNTERFITPELKEMETKTSGRGKIPGARNRTFNSVRDRAKRRALASAPGKNHFRA